MFRIIAAAFVSIVMCNLSQAATATTPQINVFVYNDAGISRAELTRAKEIAGRIFQEARVTIRWAETSDVVAEGKGGCYCPDWETTLSVRIVAHSRDLHDEAFGMAFVGSDGLGTQADVFYTGIKQLELESVASGAQVLGNVIAHELGHLLLGLNSHSTYGIMQARWQGIQLRQISMGGLGFDHRQSELMRERLLGPYARLREAETGQLY
jgi:hypothetical protein